MTDSFIPVSGTDKKLQTYENTVATRIVHSEAVTPTDKYGVPIRQAELDIFGHQSVVQPYNQVEMRLDASDWADFTDTSVANGGGVTQGSGLVTVATSTATNGSAILYSTDVVEYRPGVGIYGGGTAIFTAGAAGSTQWVGLGSDTSFANGVQFGYKAGVFGIRYMRGGAEVSFTAQADWDDPCLGAADSRFSRNGAVEVLDPTAYGGPYWIEAGLFGFAGWVAKVWSPDNGWITVLTYRHSGTTPVFLLNSFRVVLAAVKTSGATDITISSQCWAAGTGSALVRLGGTTTARTLAMPVLATLRATKPNGDHINIDATAGGNLKFSLEEVEAGVVISVTPGGSASAAGVTPYFNAALSNTKTAVKASSGRLYGYHIHNPGVVTTYVQIFDLASANVTVGTTTPTMVLAIPANASSTATLDAMFAVPVSFGTAITIAATTTAAGATAPASALVANLFYL